MLDHEKHFVPSTPEAEGIDPEGIRKFIAGCLDKGSDLHAVLLIRHGKQAFSAFFDPYQPEDKRHVYSVSKSWTATAVGLAVSEGLLSLSDKVISFFPEELPKEVSENLAAMEVRHLLMMGCGHETEPPFPEDGATWAEAFLRHPVPYGPGTHFLYNSMGTYMLSAILQKVTGQKIVDYSKPRLFEPLGISGVAWDCSPEDICCGGWGIHVSAEDIAKLGTVYLNGGLFEGQRILPESWAKEAVTAQIDNAPNAQKDWEQGYCYQIWRCQHDCFRFDGAFGQYMVAIPQKDAVLVVLSNTPNMQAVLDSLWENLLPAMGDAPVPEKAADAAEYRCPLPKLAGRDFAADYACGENSLGYERLEIRTGQNGGELRFFAGTEELCLPFGLERWQRAHLRKQERFPEMLVGAAGGWEGNILAVTVRHRNMPHLNFIRLETGAQPVLRIFSEKMEEIFCCSLLS